MKVYLKSRNGEYNAKGEYYPDSKELVVLKGSKVSPMISGGSFRSSKSVAKTRKESCSFESIVTKDVRFSSASSAANYVTGRSTNGLLAWKDETGRTLKKIMKEV